MTKIIHSLILSLSLAAAWPVLAADTPQPPADQKQQESMADFLRSNPDCTEFTDQCSFCKVADGKAECSTPQIACVKQAYQCTARAGK